MTYPGGKNGAGVYQTIINQIPPHEVYLEPFAGSAAVYRHKRRACSTVLIDKAGPHRPEWRCDPTIEFVEGCALEYLRDWRCLFPAFVYADPPYVRSARRNARDLYDHEMTDAEHVEMIDLLKRLGCPVMISGYRCELYEEHLGDWRTLDFQAMTRRGPATETLWMNYPEPTALHDYRYLGDDYRERERIKKLAGRWKANFQARPVLEQRAILSAILAGGDSAIIGPVGASSTEGETDHA